jgi:hypothetical protein
VSAIWFTWKAYLKWKTWKAIIKKLWLGKPGKHSKADGFATVIHTNQWLDDNTYVGTYPRTCSTGENQCGPWAKDTRKIWIWYDNDGGFYCNTGGDDPVPNYKDCD